MKHSIFRLLMVFALGATGCAEPTCKEACDIVRACGLGTSGLSCSSGTGSCVTGDNGCAVCLADKSCEEIRTGGCASACPGYRPS